MYWNVLELQKNGKQKYVASFKDDEKLAKEWAIKNCFGTYQITLTDVSGVEDESFDDIESELITLKEKWNEKR